MTDQAATKVEIAFARYCADENLVEDETAPHGEAFYAGFAAAINDVIDLSRRTPLTQAQVRDAKAARSIPVMRELLTNLHHEIDNQGGSEGELFEEAEETIRWLLGEYLQRGEMVNTDD